MNSYKRLVPGYEAPTYLAWSRRNRSALIRVPLYHPGKEQATRAELRCPDPACNPYLCFAAMLHAGLEGIEHGYELPEPMEQNLYHLTPEEREKRGIEQLPETLGEAIEIAAHSELVLRILGEHTFKRFVEIKRQEWDEYRVQVTPWEIEQVPAGALGDSGRRGRPRGPWDWGPYVGPVSPGNHSLDPPGGLESQPYDEHRMRDSTPRATQVVSLPLFSLLTR